uniref:Ig-like domain-containing protein n=1 Tax=Romanomermis culicivorax TaxID=13658 RepID=A0A915K683_ROMCU
MSSATRVSNFQQQDAGSYECEATLAEANALGYVELITQDPDVVQLFMEVEPDYVTLGNDVTFRCVVEGDDHATVRWHKGDGELPIRSEIDGNTLTILGVRKEDTGIYRCEADTKAGRMTTDVVLQIGSKILTNILRRYYRARRRLHHAVLH